MNVWDNSTGEELPGINRTFDFNRVRTKTALSFDGKTLFTVDNKSLEAFDVVSGQLKNSWALADHDVPGRVTQQEKEQEIYLRAVAVSPDGKALAIAVETRLTHSLVLVEADSGKVIRRVRTPETIADVLAFSPDGRWIAGDKCVWEAATLKEVFRISSPPRVSAVGFSPDSRQLVTGYYNGTALVWPDNGK
jgi:hypothetical protein